MPVNRRRPSPLILRIPDYRWATLCRSDALRKGARTKSQLAGRGGPREFGGPWYSGGSPLFGERYMPWGS